MWKVYFSKKASKQFAKLNQRIKDDIDALVLDLEYDGPMLPQWNNFSKLNKNEYHCHIKKGKPTYVACWRVFNKKEKLMEIYYVGTHEKAPY